MGRTLSALWTAISFVAVLWIAQFINAGMGGYLSNFGVHPRDLYGLIGIPLAPFIHGSWQHLIANTSIAGVLLFLVALGGRSATWRASSIIVLVSGLGTWIVASPLTVHIGASGLIMGWLTFLIFRGLYSRSMMQILLGVGVLFVYGGVLWGVLPTTVGVSWQMHLFGALGGIIAARAVGTDIREEREYRKGQNQARLQAQQHMQNQQYGQQNYGGGQQYGQQYSQQQWHNGNGWR